MNSAIELIAHARREFGWGACRTRLWLMRVHQVKVAAKTITRVYNELRFSMALKGRTPAEKLAAVLAAA